MLCARSPRRASVKAQESDQATDWPGRAGAGTFRDEGGEAIESNAKCHKVESAIEKQSGQSVEMNHWSEEPELDHEKLELERERRTDHEKVEMARKCRVEQYGESNQSIEFVEMDHENEERELKLELKRERRIEQYEESTQGIEFVKMGHGNEEQKLEESNQGIEFVEMDHGNEERKVKNEESELKHGSNIGQHKED